jgi:hypothetical protein
MASWRNKSWPGGYLKEKTTPIQPLTVNPACAEHPL